MNPIISLLTLSLLISSAFAQDCGRDCKSCTDLASCDLDTNCFYVVDGGGSCELVGTCASDCALCSEAECVSVGAGGSGVCAFSTITGACFGSTCDTDCQNCFGLDCANSRAPPFGCTEDSDIEQCVPRVPTAQPTEIPTAMPTSLIPITPMPSAPTPGTPMTPMPTVPSMTTTDGMLTTDDDSIDSMETTDDSVSESDSMETTDFDSMETTEGDSDSIDSMETTDDSGMETTNESNSDSDSDSVEIDTTDFSMDTTDKDSVDDDSVDSVEHVDTSNDDSSGNNMDGIEVDTDDSGDGVESEDMPQSVNEADDETDADDMRTNRGVDGFGKNNGLSSGKGKGNTNIVGAVLGVLALFVFVGIASGVWCYCNAREKAFVSVNVIDVDDDVMHMHVVHDERTVMMAEMNEGHAITVCEDEDIL